jgi:ABC-type transporter Mla MlaB component
VLQLDATLEIGQVTETQRRLLGLIEGASAATVDVSRISSIDTAGVQLLVALRLEAAERGTALEFRGESSALAGALRLLGLEAALSPPGTHAK